MSWCRGRHRFKCAGEVTLVGKASFESDLRQRHIARAKEVTGIVDAKPSCVIAESTVVVLPKRARQMSWMNPNGCGNRFQRGAVIKMSV